MTLAIVYKLIIESQKEKYVLIGHTFNLQETKKDIIDKLNNRLYENKKLQKLYDLIYCETDFKEFEYYFKFETLQALRKSYYPTNVLPIVMEQLEKSCLENIIKDYKIKGKEYLLLN